MIQRHAVHGPVFACKEVFRLRFLRSIEGRRPTGCGIPNGPLSAARGVPKSGPPANVGCESLVTTLIYVRAEKARKHRAVQAAFAKG